MNPRRPDWQSPKQEALGATLIFYSILGSSIMKTSIFYTHSCNVQLSRAVFRMVDDVNYYVIWTTL